VRGPHRRDGAACSRWFPTSARRTYIPVRPRRMPGLTPKSSGCARLARLYPQKGRGERDHAAPRGTWRHWPWATPPPPSTSTLATCRAPPAVHGPRAPAGDLHPHAAPGPHRGLLHVRPGTDLFTARPGAEADMAHPGAPSHLPPHRIAWRRTFPAMSTSRSWGTRDWLRTWQKMVCGPSCLSPYPDFLHDTG